MPVHRACSRPPEPCLLVVIEPHLPLGERGPIPDLRRQFNTAMWRFRTCSPWRDLPAEYGPWSTVYDRFRGGAKTGVFLRRWAR
ncbi:transposase [Sphaerimonospora sp. CA-214678]|uniref:transposase n=1 Tax=Sphaerimonospora sp. CA-214678 TaxID=3240029 RepID=UPI003D8A462D